VTTYALAKVFPQTSHTYGRSYTHSAGIRIDAYATIVPVYVTLHVELDGRHVSNSYRSHHI